MKFTSVALFVGAAAANVFARAQCNADNCARQVSITRFGAATESGRAADCTSYLAVTVSTRPGSSPVTITPTAVPIYASSCTISGIADFTRYASACVNCVGAVPTTTTIVGGCNADLCSRGLFGTNVPVASVASNTAACQSFLQTTIFGQAIITPTIIPTAATASCTAIGSALPADRFSSACVCAGFFPTITTLAVGDDK